MKKRVLLGMSGGVDSSVSAMLLQKDGFEVLGITFLFAGLKESNKIIVDEARQLALSLNIEHFVIDLREEFHDKIITYFKSEYLKGSTPFPCAKCNPELKFQKLNEFALQKNCNFISTGHYAKIELHNQKKYFYKGVDPEKDQSFFLWGLSKEIRNKLILPLGNLTKSEVRNNANVMGFNRLANKKDSLGVCFIEGNNYRNFLEKEGILSKPGVFVNESDEILGEHKGIINYTIGQRRGLGINLDRPLFVSEIKPTSNQIVLSEYNSLFKNKIFIKDYYFVDCQEIDYENIYNVKIRYRLQNTPCRIKILNENKAIIELLEPLAMISKGQTTVFYVNDRVVGGGFIESSE